MAVTDSDPVVPVCCASILDVADNAVSKRVKQLLCVLEVRFPEAFVLGSFWRPYVIPESDTYAEERDEVWVKLTDLVKVAFIEKESRFFQAQIGVVFKTKIEIYIPSYWGIRPGDVFDGPQGISYQVQTVSNFEGVQVVVVEQAHSRFVRPARTDRVYRELGVGARIV